MILSIWEVNFMLVDDSKNRNKIIDYKISFDSEIKREVLEILDECFSKRRISLPFEEAILLHKGYDLSKLKRELEDPSKSIRGGFKDLSMYYYTYGDQVPKQSAIGDIYLGEEINISRTIISCSLSSTIAFILHHLNSEERESFISRHNSIEKVYLETLLSLSGYGRLSNLLGSVENMKTFLKKCQHIDEPMQLEEISLLEKIRYFKLAYSYATLTASRSYDRGYLNSIIPVDDMECEEIQNIQEAANENTEMIRMLTLEPKRMILK